MCKTPTLSTISLSISTKIGHWVGAIKFCVRCIRPRPNGHPDATFQYAHIKKTPGSIAGEEYDIKHGQQAQGYSLRPNGRYVWHKTYEHTLPPFGDAAFTCTNEWPGRVRQLLCRVHLYPVE